VRDGYAEIKHYGAVEYGMAIEYGTAVQQNIKQDGAAATKNIVELAKT